MMPDAYAIGRRVGSATCQLADPRSQARRRLRWLTRCPDARRRDMQWKAPIEERQVALKALRACPPSETSPTRLHLLYAICREDLAILQHSLESVLRSLSYKPDSITFLQDCASPLAEVERADIRDRVPCATEFPISSYPLVKGVGRILSQLDQYIALATLASPTAWILKLDSDILFLGDRHVLDAETSGADLFGQIEAWHAPFVYAQGGCYFLRVGMVSRWADCPMMPSLREAAWRTNKVSIDTTPEDSFFSLWTRRAGGRLKLASFYSKLTDKDWVELASVPTGRAVEVLREKKHGTVLHAQGLRKDEILPALGTPEAWRPSFEL